MKDVYFAKMSSQFKEWDTQMGTLTARVGRMDEAARAGYDGTIKAMRVNRDVAFGKLQEIQAAGETTWRGLQTGVDAGWVAMRHAMEKATNRSSGRR